MEHPLFRPPAPLFFAALSAALGVILADSVQWPLAPLLGISTAAIVFAWLFRIRGIKLCRCVLFLLVFDAAGALHYQRHVLSPSRAAAQSLAPDVPRTVELTGRVLDVPDDSQRFRLSVHTAEPQSLLPQNTQLLVRWKWNSPQCGDIVRFRALLRPIPAARNPGQFDAAEYFCRQDLWAEADLLRATDGSILLPNTHWQIQTWAAHLSAAISEQLRRGIETRPQTHALISSMVLGVHAGSLLEARPWFRDTGTLHLFAVSGLNMTMLAAFLATTLRVAGLGARLGSLMALPVLMAYGIATGMGASCVRAMVMCVLILGADWIQRPAVVLNSLGGAGLLLLFWDGNNLFEGGFQLSFGIVLTLALCVRPLAHRLQRILEPDALLPKRLWNTWQKNVISLGRPVAQACSVSLIAWISGIPWSIWLFHQITPIGILVNLVAVPVAFVNLALGFLAVFCAPFGSATPALNRANAWVAERLLDFVRSASEIPKGHWAVGTPFKTPPALVVFDFGRGGAVLLRGRHKRWLLNCGNESDTRNTLVPAAHSYGIQTLDGLLLSHGNAAHIGGAITAQEAFNPKRIVNSPLEDSSLSRRHILQWFAANHISVQTTSAGDYLDASDTESLEVLYPPTELPAGVADDKGIVLRWITPSWTILFTADAGLPTERWLLANSRDRLHADVWIRGTHSRETTGTDDFVRAVGARLIVVEGSRADPRHEANRLWAARQRRTGAVVWQQETTGAVEGWGGPERRFRAFLTGEELRWR